MEKVAITPEFVKTLFDGMDGKKMLRKSAFDSFKKGDFNEGMCTLRGLLYLYKKKGGRIMKKLINLFLALAFVAIAIPTFASAEMISPNDVPSGFGVWFVRADGLPEVGDILVVRGDLVGGVKISDFVPANENKAVVDAANAKGMSIEDYLKGLIEAMNGTLYTVNHRQAGLVAYGWGKFSYNAAFNRFEVPSPGSGGGNDGSGGGSGSGDGGTGGGDH